MNGRCYCLVKKDFLTHIFVAFIECQSWQQGRLQRQQSVISREAEGVVRDRQQRPVNCWLAPRKGFEGLILSYGESPDARGWAEVTCAHANTVSSLLTRH